MSSYLLLKYLHLTLVVISGLGFLVRGTVKLVFERELMHPMTQFGPHVIDTLLLASGLGLWTYTHSSMQSWFALKMVLLVSYIGLGMTAFRMRERQHALTTFALAITALVSVAATALIKPF
ncbi:MAG: SirB2 family protein [Pseudomonadota bacterium]